MTTRTDRRHRTREERASLLAQADSTALVALADDALDGCPDPEVTQPPETGMVMLTVREPVEATRFHLGEVLVTRCGVIHRGSAGWAMRMGSDPVATVAAALLDAESEADGPYAADIELLCDATASAAAMRAAREWDAIAPTIVDFEEMD